MIILITHAIIIHLMMMVMSALVSTIFFWVMLVYMLYLVCVCVVNLRCFVGCRDS